jgi:apolipoprotein D and lipocalin family protein
MYFQNQCVGDVTANYSKLENGKIKVINRCRTKDGEFDQAEGSASVVDNTGNSQLKVSFFWPFRADYWVIGLDPDYRWAVVGNPNRKYLWILSRSKSISPSDLAAAKASAAAQGYDLTQLINSESMQ